MQFYNGLLGHDPSEYFNSSGHRCKELKDVDLHKYILFAGDNVGVDLSKPVEETYPYLISQRLKMDYYNLCVFNGGLDAIKFNLISWFQLVPQKPKMIIISTEFLNSIITSDHNHSFFTPADYNNQVIKDFTDALLDNVSIYKEEVINLLKTKCKKFLSDGNFYEESLIFRKDEDKGDFLLVDPKSSLSPS